MIQLDRLGLSLINPAACFGSEWLAGERQFTSINPATELEIAAVGACTRSDCDRAIARAAQTFNRWRTVPAPQRGELVRRIGVELRQFKDELGSLIALETGKIKQEGDGEVQEMIDMADFAVGQSRMLYGHTMQSERPHHRMYEQWHPLGVVGIITAFNFPTAVWAWNAFIAAIAGDTVVWKPSPKAPLAAIAVQHIINRIMQEMGREGVFTLVISDENAITEQLVADARIALVSFTGSSAVGTRVAEIVARRMGRCLLECSGNNAIIVDQTADLNLVLPAVVFGAVGTAGQRCTTTRRLIVHEQRYDELVQRLIGAYRQVRIGDPLDPRTLMGPLIDSEAREHFRAAISALKARGAEILYGGDVLPGPGYFVCPTIVRVQPDWEIVQRETFAPILYVMTCRSLEDAIAINNNVPQGLSSALFTDNMQHTEQFLSATGSDCGIANINIGTSGAEIGGAFGGEKRTGGGREAGSDAWKAYMRRQTVTVNWGRDLPLAQGIKFEVR